MTAGTISHPIDSIPNRHNGELCPGGCDVREAIGCWLAEERRLHADLAEASYAGSPDLEVLVFDLRHAERRIDRLIAIGRRAA